MLLACCIDPSTGTGSDPVDTSATGICRTNSTQEWELLAFWNTNKNLGLGWSMGELSWQLWFGAVSLPPRAVGLCLAPHMWYVEFCVPPSTLLRHEPCCAQPGLQALQQQLSTSLIDQSSKIRVHGLGPSIAFDKQSK
jgi:hypothetical protein